MSGSRVTLPVVHVVVLAFTTFIASACDRFARRMAPPLDAATVTARYDSRVPAELRFIDEDGHPVLLGDLLDDARPTILVFAYFQCRTLCSLVLRGMADALRGIGVESGHDVRVITVSIDPRENAADARAARAELFARMGLPAPAADWRFLRGDEASIGLLADAVGFGYRDDAGTDQYAHPAVLVVLTPAGTVSGYVHGVRPTADELTEAIRTAAAGRTRLTAIDAVLRCFRYIPALRLHAGLITAFLWTGALATVAALLLLLGGLRLHELRRTRDAP